MQETSIVVQLEFVSLQCLVYCSAAYLFGHP